LTNELNYIFGFLLETTWRHERPAKRRNLLTWFLGFCMIRIAMMNTGQVTRAKWARFRIFVFWAAFDRWRSHFNYGL